MSKSKTITAYITPQTNKYNPQIDKTKDIYEAKDFKKAMDFFGAKYEWKYIGSRYVINDDTWKPFQYIFYNHAKNAFLYQVGRQFPPPEETNGLGFYVIYVGSEKYLPEVEDMIAKAFPKEPLFTLERIEILLNTKPTDDIIFLDQVEALKALAAQCSTKEFDEYKMNLFLKGLNHPEQPRLIACTIYSARHVAWKEMMPHFEKYISFTPNFNIENKVIELIKREALSFTDNFELHKERALTRLEGEFIPWWIGTDYEDFMEKEGYGLDELAALPPLPI
jgi:hypothetical protein